MPFNAEITLKLESPPDQDRQDTAATSESAQLSSPPRLRLGRPGIAQAPGRHGPLLWPRRPFPLTRAQRLESSGRSCRD